MNEQANETLNEQISAYVDGALSGRELASFEELLAANPELVEKIEITRLLRQTARALPAARLPRSFTLPPNTKPTLSFWQRLFGDAAQAQKIMRFGSAIATALFVFFAGMGLLNASAPPARVALVEATPTSTSPAPMVMSAMEAPAAKVIPIPRDAPLLGGGGPDIGGLGGGPPGNLGEQIPDVVPTNPPLPTAIPSPTATPTATPTPVVSVPVPHTASLSWAWVAGAFASLVAAVVLGVLGWRRQR
ncbi:MAG TPA: hypothetical protein PLJ62_03410 [Thermoflexales bacterium]|nr:hypothetical protein [Thermoflexales bacterium]